MDEICNLTLTLETVTPLFLGGADPRGAPELRAPSVRGALRYWLRALWGSVLGDRDLKTLQNRENAVLGFTDIGASPVNVRVHGTVKPERLEVKMPTREGEPAGAAYMFWSMLRLNRDALPAGSTFTLTLQTRPPLGRENNAALTQAAAALWLLTRLGGLGARSRRGAGSLAVLSVQQGDTKGWPDLRVRANTPAELKEELERGLREWRRIFDVQLDSSLKPPTQFDVLHPDACQIRVLDKTWPTWEAALEEVGNAFKNFRYERPPEHPAVEQIVSATAGLGTGRGLARVERAAFGLPLPFYFGSVQRALESKGVDRREAQRKAQAVVQPEREDIDRRASPLSFKVVHLANGEYAVVVIFFKAELLASKKLALKQGRRILATTTVPGLGSIDEFLDALHTAGGESYVAPLLEVNYR